MTIDPASRSVSPYRAILATSLILGVFSIACLRFARSDSFLFGVSLGLLTVCSLPWLVVLRRRVWSRRYPNGGRWMIAVTALLWVSLLIGPLITGSVWVWAEFSDAPMGWLAVLGFGVISFTSAYWSATLALVIQIWRDQWRIKLTGVSIAFLFLLFVPYVWAHTKPNKSRAEGGDDQPAAAVDSKAE